MRLAVAVSGGVDSLSALLQLHRAGYDVIALHGLFLPRNIEVCCTPTNASADPLPGLEAICKKLKIPLHIIDLRDDFQKEVIDPFITSYAVGHTPNPCALCNRSIKFGKLREAAVSLGADKLATGHYARLLSDENDISCGLAAAADPTKDQSYFLSLVPATYLKSAVFPLAGQTKAMNIDLVRQSGVTVPLSGESQDICFIAANDTGYRIFLTHAWKRFGSNPTSGGAIRLAESHGQDISSMRRVGCHHGLWQYTEGQRKGLGIAHSEPLYVLRKDMTSNTLVVGPRALLGMKGCRTGKANIFVPQKNWPSETLVKLRYRQQAVPADICLNNGCLEIQLDTACFPSAPGQVAALYDKEGQVLAGGIITECF